MEYSIFKKIVYSFDPSPLVDDFRGVVFIRLHHDWLRIYLNENYCRVRFFELVSNNGKPTVYVANCRYKLIRSGHYFSHTCASSLLHSVCDHIGRIL